MTYRSVVATRLGSTDVLEVAENELRAPAAGEVRIKVLASSVCRPDVSVRSGEALYSGTRLGHKPPFVPGYSAIGAIDAVGEGVSEAAVGDRVGALTVVGSYTEYLYWDAKHLIPVPEALDPAEAVPLILNYIVAYQVMHRLAKVQAGGKALIVGASGGIGTALLELGKLADLTMYGLASQSKHPALIEMGAIPIDYRTQDFVEVIRKAEPDGLDYIFDGMTRQEYVERGYKLLKRGGTMVSFGEPPSLAALPRFLAKLVWTHLWPDGRTYKLYGTSGYTFNPRPFLEDWATLFRLLGEGRIKPVIAAKFPILEAAKANDLLESGEVVGNIVLLAPELMQELA
ncbi:MAG: medium chain dehydrogenase/reductase family protein [Chloroflexota bacterium]